MNQIVNRNGLFSSASGEAATGAYAIKVLISAIDLFEKGIRINARMGKKQLLLRAEQWLGEKPKSLADAKARLQAKMNELIGQCEVVNE